MKRSNAMRAMFYALIGAALLLGACATEPEKPAASAPVGEAGKPGATPQPVKPSPPVARVEPGKPGGSPFAALKDPNNILSRRTVYFDFDRFEVRDEYRPLVEAHAKFLRANPSAKMLIQGNTDERGSREYNIGLGQRRADGVKKMLSLLGVKEDQVESTSLGEEKPKSEGHGEEAWAQNRRSDMLYNGEY
jgi:peptidoglycan-associated lipoprotein